MFPPKIWQRMTAAVLVCSAFSPGIPVNAEEKVDSSLMLATFLGKKAKAVPAGSQGCPPCQSAPVVPVEPSTPTLPSPSREPLQLPSASPDRVPTMPSDLGTSAPSFANILGGAGLGESVGVSPGGYIDNAVPVTMFRLTYDTAYRNNRPDRAEFFYAKCGCFGTPDAKGPGVVGVPETSVDFQELSPYLEYAFSKRFSAFVSIPIRFINPEVNGNTAGLSDVWFGVKYAFLRTESQVASLQLRAITPSGDSDKGLGTNNWWLEPGLLYFGHLADNWVGFAELRDQIYLSRSSDFTGNVLRYGVGTSYLAWQGQRLYVAPVVEFVGWTVLSGKELSDEGAVSAAGDTIVNGKFGIRIGRGEPGQGFYSSDGSDLYIGYGRALTGEVWYKDMLRIQYRYFF